MGINKRDIRRKIERDLSMVQAEISVLEMDAMRFTKKLEKEFGTYDVANLRRYFRMIGSITTYRNILSIYEIRDRRKTKI